MGNWVPMAGREGGAILAIAMSPGFEADHLVLAATHAGLFRSKNGGESWEVCSEGLGSYFVQSVVFSPYFLKDRTLYAGVADGGIYRSTSSGDGWSLLARPGSSAIVTVCVAPGRKNGTSAMAGTLAEGVFVASGVDGEWKPFNTGLKDLSVIDLAISPSYETDRTAIVATADGLYRSTDGKGWRRVMEYRDGDSIEVVRISPSYATDRTIFAGTERGGALRSRDGGNSWQPVAAGLPDSCVNGLAISPRFSDDRTVAVATGSGAAISTDGGDSWRGVAGKGEVSLSVCLSAGSQPGSRVVLAGLAHRGMLRSEDGGASWKAANSGLSAYSLVGLALSPSFTADGLLFSWGPSEGIVRSVDGGKSWEPSSTGLGAATVTAVVPSPGFETDGALFASTSYGVFSSTDRGGSWKLIGLNGTEVKMVAVSPGFAQDRTLVAASDEGLHLSADGGASWEELEAPARGEDFVALKLAVGNEGDPVLLVGSWREATSTQRGRLRIWSGSLSGSDWKFLFWRDGDPTVVSLAVPDSFSEDARFFIGAGQTIFRVVPGARERTNDGIVPLWVGSSVRSKGYPVVSVAAAPDFARTHSLLAVSGEGVYLSEDEALNWKRVSGVPGGRPPVAMVPSPFYAEDGSAYVLTIGGQLWKWDPED